MEVVKGTTLSTRMGAHLPPTHPPGRACPCGTPLSTYNKGPNCWAHTKPKFRSPRGRKR